MDHIMYKDGDENIPDVLLDSNGQVALGMCKVCELAEGALTTDCPGCTTDKDNEVYAGKIDFRDGEWVKEVSPHSPARFAFR